MRQKWSFCSGARDFLFLFCHARGPCVCRGHCAYEVIKGRNQSGWEKTRKVKKRKASRNSPANRFDLKRDFAKKDYISEFCFYAAAFTKILLAYLLWSKKKKKKSCIDQDLHFCTVADHFFYCIYICR